MSHTNMNERGNMPAHEKVVIGLRLAYEAMRSLAKHSQHEHRRPPLAALAVFPDIGEGWQCSSCEVVEEAKRFSGTLETLMENFEQYLLHIDEVQAISHDDLKPIIDKLTGEQRRPYRRKAKEPAALGDETAAANVVPPLRVLSGSETPTTAVGTDARD